MSSKTHATIEDLYKVEGHAELVGGEIVEMPPAGDDPGYASGEIFVSLRAYARRARRGRAFGDDVGFHVNLPHGESFSPERIRIGSLKTLFAPPHERAPTGVP